MGTLERVRPELEDPTAPVFGGLGGRAIAARIRGTARAAGLDGDFSGHSPRIGMARDPRRVGRQHHRTDAGAPSACRPATPAASWRTGTQSPVTTAPPEATAPGVAALRARSTRPCCKLETFLADEAGAPWPATA